MIVVAIFSPIAVALSAVCAVKRIWAYRYASGVLCFLAATQVLGAVAALFSGDNMVEKIGKPTLAVLILWLEIAFIRSTSVRLFFDDDSTTAADHNEGKVETGI